MTIYLSNAFSLIQIFDVNSLDLQRVAKAFGFTVPPNVNLGGASLGNICNLTLQMSTQAKQAAYRSVVVAAGMVLGSSARSDAVAPTSRSITRDEEGAGMVWNPSLFN